jgi:competence CoiA-like predicted nuclease
MPFVAKHKETGERFDITQSDNPRTLPQNTYCCPLCETPFYVRASVLGLHHFVYAKQSCSSTYRFHEESPEHLEAKVFLARHLREDFPEYTDATIDLEVPLPEIQRRADLLVTFPSGWRQAHEIQLSPISERELQERSEDYGCLHIDVVWWLGKRANTAPNRAWCIEHFGYCLGLNFYE